MLSKILAETKFVQKVLTILNSNELILVKQKYFSSINTPNMLFKIIKQICYFFFVKLCKNSSTRICVLL